MMQLIAQNYYRRDLSKENMIKVFSDIQLTSKFEKNRIIACNYKQKLTHLQYGSKAPVIYLTNRNGQNINLDNSDDIVIEYNTKEKDKPIVVRPANKNNITYIIMPMIMS